MSKEERQPWETGKGKVRGSHQESPERNTTQPIPWFYPSDTNFGLPTSRTVS